MNTQHTYIIAGPCSVDEKNINQIINEIAPITGIFGTRVVGLKSRTALSSNPSDMGMDFAVYQKNLQNYLRGARMSDLETPPSVLLARQIVTETNMMVATEIMSPLLQLPAYDGIPSHKLLAWNPSVNQIGWTVYEMAELLRRNQWYLGLKNGKWHRASMEKVWEGLVSYGAYQDMTFCIQRGVDVPEKGDYRNLPLHESTAYIKKQTNVKVLFDPSHTHGPKLRHMIVDESINAMKMRAEDGIYLYDGILIEAGDSKTDTHQHVTIDELKKLVDEVSQFRELAHR